MLCAISGNVPEEPVCTADGHVFEKRLLEKHVEETGRHPISGDELKKEDIIDLKFSKTVKPRPSPVTSIPGLLGLFHNEWDSLMLETHALQQSLNGTRQELAHALYQHDAACRVIARLVRLQERDEARAALETAQTAVPVANGKRAAGDDIEQPAKKARTAGITEDIVKAMTECSMKLSKGRKQRQPALELASVDDMAAFQLLASQPLHKTGKGGIRAIDMSPASGSVVATAGSDGVVTVYNSADSRLLAELRGHTKKVNDVKFFGSQDVLLSASSDHTACIWRASEEDGAFAAAAVLKTHNAEVTAVTAHPTHQYFVTSSMDKTWAFYDADTASCLVQVSDAELDCGITTAAFHPDGVILGTGCQDTMVRVWEVRQQKNVAKFAGHTGPITSMSFSENGYYLATSAADGVKLWDLRKLKNFRTLVPYDNGAPCTSVDFDHSGLYLAVGGADARVYGVKQDWSIVQTFLDMPQQGATAVKFGGDAQALYVGSSDHNLRIYGMPAT